MTDSQYYQKGLGLKAAIEGTLQRDYHSELVERLRASGSRMKVGDLTIRLAEEFGFCYGVDRAVEYAYETVEKFPDRRVFLTGEIIHNPRVNQRMDEMGISFFPTEGEVSRIPSDLGSGDVVILPAFGVPEPVFAALRQRGCIMVDTTCGSVLNVWKNVEKYAKSSFTSIIHGKFAHEETRATASRALMYDSGRYLIVKDMAQAEIVCDYIVTGGTGQLDRDQFLEMFRQAISPDFDPQRHLERIGVANQTTMLSSESLAIAGRLKEAMLERYGADQIESRFRSFDTICSATQDRQDAVLRLVNEGIDLMIIIGGYNSSNTNHLTSIGEKTTPTFHIDAAECIINAGEIRHKPYGSTEEVVTHDWLPDGSVTVGVTAGASTPGIMIGEVVESILRCRGLERKDI